MIRPYMFVLRLPELSKPDHYFCSGGAGHLHLLQKAKTTLIPLDYDSGLADRDLCGDLCFGV